MVTPFPCSNCNGLGCSSCSGVGFFGRDENYEYYLSKDKNGQVVVAGLKQSSSSKNPLVLLFSFFFKLISKQLEEPYDLIWAIKQRKK